MVRPPRGQDVLREHVRWTLCALIPQHRDELFQDLGRDARLVACQHADLVDQADGAVNRHRGPRDGEFVSTDVQVHLGKSSLDDFQCFIVGAQRLDHLLR